MHVNDKSENYIYDDPSKLPRKTAVLVLGAQVHGKTLSYVLQDRVDMGIMLYKSGKARKMLLSGDHGKKTYDEVNAMRRYVLNKDRTVKDVDLFMDHAGFDTYDSIYRARNVFCVDGVIIVSQKFHVARAVYIARELGIDAVGIGVDEDDYIFPLRIRWQIRESLARVKAFLDVTFHSRPKYLGEKIPIYGDGRKTVD